MTIPTIRDSASYTSAVNETLRAVMPADVQEGDLLVVNYAGDGALTGLLAQSGDFEGWSLYSSQRGTSLVSGTLLKIADGTEGGLTLIAGTSPSEKWCVSALALQNADPTLQGAGFVYSGTGSNPNPGAVPLSADYDHLVLVNVAGEGATATTADPSGYTGAHNLNNGSADGVSLRTAYKAISAGPTTEDPGVWTRASTAWLGQTRAFRGVMTTARRQRILGRKTEVLSGATKDYSVTVRAGFGRRFFCALHAASSTVSAITLDPGGANETVLTRVQTVGGAFAESASSGTARAVTWYEVWPVPPAGSYTLRVETSVTGDCALHSLTMLNCEQKPIAYDVLNVAASGSDATGNITIPDWGIVLSAGVQPMSTHPSPGANGNSLIWGIRLGQNQRSSWTPPHYCTVFARHVSGGGMLALTLQGNITGSVPNGNVQAFSAFSVGYYEDDPIWASTDF